LINVTETILRIPKQPNFFCNRRATSVKTVGHPIEKIAKKTDNALDDLFQQKELNFTESVDQNT